MSFGCGGRGKAERRRVEAAWEGGVGGEFGEGGHCGGEVCECGGGGC